jgi:hypothetical protein
MQIFRLCARNSGYESGTDSLLILDRPAALVRDDHRCNHFRAASVHHEIRSGVTVCYA